MGPLLLVLTLLAEGEGQVEFSTVLSGENLS